MSLFPDKDILPREIESWRGFAASLRAEDRELFNRMLDECYAYAAAINAKGDSISEVKSLMPKVRQTFERFAAGIRNGRVPIEDLVFTKQLSKDAGQYHDRNTIENNSISQLFKEGKVLKAGQTLRYVITDYKRRRTVPVEFIDGRTSVDVERYVELLVEVCNSLTAYFGYKATQE